MPDRDRRRTSPLTVLLTAAAVVNLACGTDSAGTSPSILADASASAPASSEPSTAASTVPSQSLEASPMTTPSPSVGPLTLTSSAFGEGQPIPAKFSCHGADVSPPLSWHGVPSAAKALVLFVDDPDGRDWVHWSVLDLPARDGELPEGVAPNADRPQQGRNDFRKVGYGGPCPPSGTHHYRFTLYALSKPLNLDGHPDGTSVRRALKGANVLAKVTLTGTYRA